MASDKLTRAERRVVAAAMVERRLYAARIEASGLLTWDSAYLEWLKADDRYTAACAALERSRREARKGKGR